MKLTKKVKNIIVVLVVAVVGVSGVTVACQKSSESDTEMVYKETSVEKGNLVVGVTESGSVSIGSVEQTIDLDDTTASSTSSSSSSSASTASSTGSSAGGASTGGAGTTATAATAATGTADTSSTSSSTSSLEVDEVYVTTGQTVSEGDALLKITDDSIADYRETLTSAVTTATLALKEANLSAQTQKLEANYSYDTNIANGSVAQSQYDSTITSLTNAVTSAQSELDESAAKIADYQARIAAGEDVSSQLADEQVSYSTLQAKLTSAQNNYTTKSIEAKETYDNAMLNYNNASSILSIDTNGISDDVEEAQDTLDTAQEALDDFESMIGDGKVYAEYSGTIMSVGYATGDTVSSSTSVATFSDDTAVTMSVSVSQEDITAVAIGDTVNIALTAYEDETFEGTVTSIDTSSSSDSSTVNYEVTVAFTGDISKVYADMTGDVTFITKQVDDVVYVSDKAIINEGTTSYVDIKDDSGNIERMEVTTGFSNGVNVEITSGLEEGQTALIESQVSE